MRSSPHRLHMTIVSTKSVYDNLHPPPHPPRPPPLPSREFQERDQEVKANRLSSAELERLQEETATRREEEKREREAKTRRKGEDIRLRKMEEVWPVITLCHYVMSLLCS